MRRYTGAHLPYRYALENVESPTIVGAQAANELLNIIGIKASFVLTEYMTRFISALVQSTR